MRYPAVANQFYPGDKDELISTIKECFLHKLGIQKLPEKKESNTSLKAVISPHAGYMFSGPCMSHAFYEIANAKTPETYIIIGLSHHGFNTCLSDDDFQTPLGVLKNNKKLTKLISDKCRIKIDNNSHSYEHSLEVLLPFLQFVKQGKDIQIVPLIIGRETLNKIKEVGKSLKQALKEHNIIFLVSSDFTHYGYNFDFTPYEPSKIEEYDMKAIELIKKGKTEDLYNYHTETGITICGIYPIMVLLEAINFTQCTLLSYYKSTDIVKMDQSSSVSYASIIFK